MAPLLLFLHLPRLGSALSSNGDSVDLRDKSLLRYIFAGRLSLFPWSRGIHDLGGNADVLCGSSCQSGRVRGGQGAHHWACIPSPRELIGNGVVKLLELRFESAYLALQHIVLAP